jgi:hypothetical protein
VEGKAKTAAKGGPVADQTRPCEICGQPIHPDRIEAVPDTRLCLEHSKQINKYGGEFFLLRSQARLNKAGSLKRNYGDVSAQKQRNTEALRKLRAEFEQSRDAPAGRVE